MNVTDRNKVADELFANLSQLGVSTPEDKVAVAGMLAAKVIASAVDDTRNRSAAVRSLQATMSAQLTLETAGDHRALQPIGRMGVEDDE